MWKYILDSVVGLVVGVVFLIFVPSVFISNGGLPGYDFLSSTYPFLMDRWQTAVFVVAVVYIIFGLIPFGIYVTMPSYKKRHRRTFRELSLSFFSFSFGIIVAYSILITVILFAATRVSGPSL